MRFVDFFDSFVETRQMAASEVSRILGDAQFQSTRDLPVIFEDLTDLFVPTQAKHTEPIHLSFATFDDIVGEREPTEFANQFVKLIVEFMKLSRLTCVDRGLLLVEVGFQRSCH